MDPSQSYNQPPVAYDSSEKSVMLQPAANPPVYQNNSAGYPPSFASSSVQGSYPGQSVVTVQPAVFVSAAPLANPMPEYTCYSIFTLICCCLPLGTAALVYSLSTRSANHSGHLELAKKNSETARNLNHAAVVVGIILIVLMFLYEFLWNNKNTYP
ncbi:hypothetical protein Q8A67_008248 [Cirrhinus molitorella]|uniref:Uncharacterized protein n=1 Tax=Cirrhinus molitorella TaxID=172907 RepID=A0AA88TSL8_9TELE|nr:hypothetical protein Q8A67_008248 [Cirrhinus molitorella]